MVSADESVAKAKTDRVELTLGPCHYGDFAEDATVMGTARDGIGWIPVCDEHRQRAIDDGYELADG